jgi:pantoate--beta-alanine ligase
LFKALRAAGNAATKRAEEIIAVAREVIHEATLARIDYVKVVDADTLQPVETAGGSTVLLLAVFFGKTRLIDNIRLP